MSSLLGKIFGTTEVVPPPPSVTTGSAKSGNGTSLSANVVPPPPSVTGGNSSGSPRGTRSGTGMALNTNVVPPPPSVGGYGATGTHSSTENRGGSLYSTNVVPPPPSVSSTGRGGGKDGREGAPGGTLIARTNAGGGEVTTTLGPGYLSNPHRFRIDWSATAVSYYIDGATVATHNVAVPGTMRPIAAKNPLFSCRSGRSVAITTLASRPSSRNRASSGRASIHSR